MNQMKAHTLAAAMLLSCATAQAQKANSLVMSWNDDSTGATETQTFPLGEIAAITFCDEDGSVTVETTGGTTATYDESQAWTGTFAYVHIVPTAIAEPAAIDGAAEIWTLSGTRMRGAADGTTLPAGALPHGVYIIRENGTSRKVTL